MSLLLVLGGGLAALTFPAHTAFAQYAWCTGAPRTACGVEGAAGEVARVSEYGPFLCDVCQASCIELGQCSWSDIMIVTGNIANFVLSMTGAIALLLFVIGGIFLMISKGQPDKVKKGWQYFRAAIFGLALSFGGVLIINTVLRIIRTGTLG